MEEKDTEEKINALLKDIDSLDELNNLGNEDNLFDILKISQAEIRHSNALAWLCDPQKSGDVGKYFLRKLFILIMERAEKFYAADLIVDDLDDVEVRREWKCTDLLITLRKKDAINFVICIENKVKSKQGDRQLERYRQTIETEEEFKFAVQEKRVAYLFLRVKNESPKDQNWIEIDYNDIGSILKDALTHCSMSKELNFFITQYLSTLRKNGMMDDQKMQELAQKIYNKHKDALDYIYENAQNEDALKFEHYHKWLSGKTDFTKRQNKAFSYLQFATKELHEKIFENLDVKNIDVVQYCFYEIQKRFMNEIKLVLHKDNSLPSDVQSRLDEVRTKLIKKSNTDWQWASACKGKIGAEHHFDKYDLNNEQLDEELTKTLNKALEKCQSAVLEAIR